MGEELYASLAWLPKPPADFRSQCRAALTSARPAEEVMRLAGYALDETQLQQLAAVIRTLNSAEQPPAPLTRFKLGLVSNATLEPLIPALVGSAARHGIALQCVAASFGQSAQEALQPDSLINREKPDAVLLALDYRGLPLTPGTHDAQTASSMVADAVAWLRTLRTAFRTHGNALSIVQTIAPPPETLFGSFDRCVPGTLHALAPALNTALVDDVRATHDVLFDVASLAETVGVANWNAPTQWHLAKFAFDARFLPLYADHVARILGALRGKSRRCLILDLDNTVWGGVIGDDGLEGIVIGQGDATGEAYLDVQSAALALRDRGIVLAVSSKNDDAVARSAFLRHPEMLLRENHVAVFQANWNDKATNIKAIASELSLGLDAMVFLDDNPVERDLIRKMLPDVAVPELPDNPALYARTLAAAGYFESVAFSEEDRRRSEFYEANARRVALAHTATDLGAYLASLKMEIVFRPFDAMGRARIAQLVNKSNQFNLTTRRYSELEIAECESDPARFTLQVRLLDAFGDNGMISVVICRPRSATDWEIDTWLMSCRVLGRGVEQMVLREILHHARANGIKRLIGVYRPTDRNRMVADFYSKFGFDFCDQDAAGTTTWELDTAVEIEAAPMTVTRAGFELSTV